MIKLNWIAVACAGCLLLVSTGVKTATPARGFTLLATLDADSASPTSPLVQAAGGKLYGTATNSGPRGHGSVFTVTPGGVLTVLGFLNGAVGSNPHSGLIQATDGSFYGTAESGGVNGFGSIYKITSGGKASTLYSFCPTLPCSDGEEPTGGLVQASDGNFYGTTNIGGHGGNGTVFRITLAGTLTVLHRFNSTDGSHPSSGVIQGSDGDLYGVTVIGGATNEGTIFKITTSGVLTTLHEFSGPDGIGGNAALVQGTDGNFYGSTYLGGNMNGVCFSSGCGTIFQITPGGTFTTLYKFSGNDGSTPEAALIQANGNFYGTAAGGGNDRGTIFRITPSGVLTTLYNFCPQAGCPDGASPNGLVQNTNGVFYGTTIIDGASNHGTVYSFSLGFPQFVKTLPLAAQVGAAVRILGTNLTGASSVTFNGIPATFTVKSQSNITTTVPNGATTGPIQVITPHGTLSSNIPFQVLP